MGLDEFRARVQEYRRALGFTQKQLAHELGLSPTVLSHKLHETDGMRLTQVEIKAIVKLLARWQAIYRHSDAIALLELMSLKPNVFTDAEWTASPLKELEQQATVSVSVPISPTQPTVDEDTLPTPVTALIGREALIASVIQRLSDGQVRLLTLTGPGGVGKTRIALELARRSREHYADGILWIPLAGINDWTLVTTEIALHLKLKASASGSVLVDKIKAVLSQRNMLLILDNFEHVINAAPLVAQILQAADRLKIVVTSRTVLNVYGEHQVRVPALELPDLQRVESPQHLVDQPAVALFVARSQAVRRDFVLTEANARVVAEICVRLDGLPLALELAAARCRLFSPAALLQRLDQPLELLSGGAINAGAHQRTLRDTIAWSYALLDSAEQGLFRVISAFPGGCSIEALEAVYIPPGDSARPLIDLLTSLLDKSLIDQCELPNGELRITMLETLREFGGELLADSNEWNPLRERQARHYVRWLEATVPNLSGRTQVETAAQIEQENDNIRAILSWSAHTRPEAGIGIVGSLSPFWNMRGLALEGLRWASLLLGEGEHELKTDTLKASYAKAYNSGGALAFATGDYSRAQTYLHRALTLRIQIEDSEGIASTYNNLGNLAWNQSDFLSARRYFEEAVRIAEEIENTKLVASVLNNLGTLLQNLNDFPQAEYHLRRALEIWRSFGNKQSIANTLSNLAGIALRHQEFDQAMTYYVESLTLQLEMGNKRNAGAVLANMGEIALNKGEFADAKNCFEQTLALQREVDYLWGVGSAIGDLGRVAFYQGDYGTAIARLQEALTMMRQFNDTAKLALIQDYLGAAALKMKDTASALTYLRDAVKLYHELDDAQGMASALACFAAVIAVQGDAPTAARLGGAAFQVWSRSGTRILPVDRFRFMTELEAARTKIGSEPFDVAWQTGSTMTTEEILTAVG